MAMASLSAMAVDVIVHKDVLVSQIGLASARAIFGMRQVKWPDGSLIRVFVLGDQHPLHVALCKEELNIYPYQLRQSWDRLVYSGMAQAPRQVESEEEMAALVAATPGAIGYVNKTKNNPSIRVLHVD
jgi:hypothetical protein